jgi:hypothetical protein
MHICIYAYLAYLATLPSHSTQTHRHTNTQLTQCALNSPIYIDIRHTTYDIRNTTYNIRHTTYNIRHTTYDIRHTTYDIRHTTCDIQVKYPPTLCTLCTLCTLYYVLCTLFQSRWITKPREHMLRDNSLVPISYILYPMSYVLYPMSYILYPKHIAYITLNIQVYNVEYTNIYQISVYTIYIR